MHRNMLSQDIMAVLINRRETIEAVMAQHLAGTHQGAATDEDKFASHRLFEALLDGLKGEPPRLDYREVRRHAGRFGDGLTAILRDVLGPDISDASLARCVDRYWTTLQAAAA